MNMMRRLLFVAALVLAACLAANAQIVVYDPAVTARNSVTAVVEETLKNVQDLQRRLLRKMSRRLSLFTDLRRYQLPEPPRWRIHIFNDPSAVLFAGDYNAALNYGDASGNAYRSVTVPLLDSVGLPDEEMSPDAVRDFAARLATIDVADAVAMSATNDTGHVRYNGRREQDAIEILENDVIDPSQEQSATAVVDKISGAVLIGARQRQARTELLVGMVEQLLVDSKRERDTEAAAMNMQLTTWRASQTANAAFVAGSGDALRTWRQP
jgi:hypothetical protein